MKKSHNLKEAVVLLTATIMILSSIVVVANTETPRAALGQTNVAPESFYKNNPATINSDLVWDNGDPNWVNGLCVQRGGAVAWADGADDFTLTEETTIEMAVWTTVDTVTTYWSGIDDLVVYEFSGSGSPPGAEIINLQDIPNTRVDMGTSPWGYPYYEYTIDLLAEGLEFTLSPGTYFIMLRPVSTGTTGQSYWTTADGHPDSQSEFYWRSDHFGVPNWSPATVQWGTAYDVSFKLYGSAGAAAIPDLDCNGELDFVDVEPNATVSGTITVENVGEVDSKLDWEVESYPDWGNWTFDPMNGVDLLAGETATIDVDIVAPNEENTEFTGEVVLVNSEDPDDTCIVEVSLVTPLVKISSHATPSSKIIKNSQHTSPLTLDDIIWDNGPDTGSAWSSQRDNVYPFISQVADDFLFDVETTITDVHFFGQFWGGTAFDPIDIEIYIYADDGTGNAPTGGGMPDPSSTALASYNFAGVTGLPLSGNGNYEYDVILPDSFVCNAGEKYWLAIVAAFNFPPQWGWVNTGQITMSPSVQGFPLLAMPFWTLIDPPVDMAFYLTGTSGQPTVPDLDCNGELDFVDITPGDTVTGTITVENVGEPDSLLNWEVESYPDWGTWSFDPMNGVDLLAGETATIDVEIVAPNEENTEFTGEVVLVNGDDPDDICIVEVSLVTPLSHSVTLLELLAQRFPILAKILSLIF